MPQTESLCDKMPKQAAKEAIDEGEEIYQTQISEISVDDSQLVTLKLESGNYLRFQVDTGAQCNIMPLEAVQESYKGPRASSHDARQAEDHSVRWSRNSRDRKGTTQGVAWRFQVPT